jgi:hypothetical protein
MRCALANNASFLPREYTTGREINEIWPAFRLDQRKCSLAITNQLVEIRLPDDDVRSSFLSVTHNVSSVTEPPERSEGGCPKGQAAYAAQW